MLAARSSNAVRCRSCEVSEQPATLRALPVCGRAAGHSRGTSARDRIHHAVRSTELLSTVTGISASPAADRRTSTTTKLDSNVEASALGHPAPTPVRPPVSARYVCCMVSPSAPGTSRHPTATGLPRFEHRPCAEPADPSSALPAATGQLAAGHRSSRPLPSTPRPTLVRVTPVTRPSRRRPCVAGGRPWRTPQRRPLACPLTSMPALPTG
jgi:hypothetical protein